MMVTHRSFGRRVNPGARFAGAGADAVLPSKKAEFGEVPAEPPPRVAANADAPSLDQELEIWKQTRPGIRIPWRQVSLMASLCFGIASFVLPDSVNDNVQWLLYALMAASLYAGFSKRFLPAKA
jgi:hypothetical protein